MTSETPTNTAGPWKQFKQTYTPLYRTLLVLSTIGTMLALQGLSGLPLALAGLTDQPIASAIRLVNLLIGLPLAIAGLILLWRRHQVGLWFKLASYGVSVITAIVGFFAFHEVAQQSTDMVIESFKQSNVTTTTEQAAQLAEFSYFFALALSIGISLIFAWLWWMAWNKQAKHDHKKRTDQ